MIVILGEAHLCMLFYSSRLFSSRNTLSDSVLEAARPVVQLPRVLLREAHSIDKIRKSHLITTLASRLCNITELQPHQTSTPSA